MTGQKRPRNWNYIEELITLPEFKKDVRKIRDENEFVRVAHTSWLIDKYKIPTIYHAVIYDYVENNTLKPELADEYIQVVSDGNGVSLRLSFDTKPSYAIDFIKQRWNELVAPLMEQRFTKSPKVGGAHLAERDEKIYQEYLEAKKTRGDIDRLAARYKLTRQRVNQIVKKMERKM